MELADHKLGAKLGVLFPLAPELEGLAGLELREGSQNRGQLRLAFDIEAGDGIAVIWVVEGNPFHDAGQGAVWGGEDLGMGLSIRIFPIVMFQFAT